MGFLDNKTEAATPKRRGDARKKGQVARSRDIVSVVVLIAGFCAIRSAGPAIWSAFRGDLLWFLDQAMSGDRMDAMTSAPVRIGHTLAVAMAPLSVAVMLGALISNVAQTGPMLLSDPLKIDFNKLNPVTGLKRVFSQQSIAELAKSGAKVGVVTWVVYKWFVVKYPDVLATSQMDITQSAQFASALVVALFWKTMNVLIVIALIDFAWQRYSFENSLKMSRDELKDEIKQMDGNPEIKGAIRRRQREIGRNRMIAAVRDADVVITNPTHYAVALMYKPETMDAPVVVALGQRLTALRIKEEAKEHGVPIVENKPLARALFAACNVGSLVPAELYAAVAQVLAYVYRLAGKR
ncbi:MAG: flagellar biosynthesis protein FlhB [Armatimonadetes bacterium]|nr:flagellar biosynthesis protein FlhB [Armatimonadota bacterium]